MIPWNLCKGCKALYIDEEDLFKYKVCKDYVSPKCFIKNKKIITCPCVECLVKMVCTEACDDFEFYRRNFSSPWRVKISEETQYHGREFI